MSQINWPEMSVLVAEDESDLREILVTVFEAEGCKVLEAKNGEEAAQIVRKNPVDIVISDIRMPVCDGIELLEKIRSEHPDNPIVFLSTGFADITEAQAKEKGAACVIYKPYTIQDLFLRLEKSLIESKKFTKTV